MNVRREQVDMGFTKDVFPEGTHIDELCAEIDAIVAEVGGSGGPPSPPPAEDDAVNWSEALKAVSGKPSLLRTIVEAALADIPSVMAAISAGVAADDPVKARLAAHNLRGSVRYFGAKQVVQLAQIIETMGDEEDLTGAARLVAVLEDEVKRLVVSLSNYLRGPCELPAQSTRIG